MRQFTAIATLAALLLGGCTNGTQVTEQGAGVEHEGHATALNDDTFQQAIDSSPVVMVDFWAPWCAPCRRMTPTIEALSVEFEGRALVAKLDVDEGRNTAGAFEVDSIPTVVFFKDGREVERMKGVRSKQELVAVLNGLLQ